MGFPHKKSERFIMYFVKEKSLVRKDKENVDFDILKKPENAMTSFKFIFLKNKKSTVV